MNYLFDTTALAAHSLGEAGASEVQALLDEEEHDLFFSALSLFELAGVLKQQGEAEAIAACWTTYRRCASVIPVDADLTEAAWLLRESLGQRIPIADAIIAASAHVRGATLVHRDRHLALIPTSVIPQLQLSSE